MPALFYELTAEIRATDAPRMRQAVTVTDPTAWAWRCFGLDFAALCLTCATRGGLLYAQPSRAWMPCPQLGEGCDVRLLGMRRVVPGTLAHNLTSSLRRACAGEVGEPIRRGA